MNKLLLFPDYTTSPSLTATSNCTCIEPIWEEGRTLSPTDCDFSCIEPIWEEGRTLSPTDCDFSNLEFWCETLPAGKITDFSVTDLGAPIVSEYLKKILDDLGVQAQYFPVSIIEKPGTQPKQGYYAVNFMGLVDCIDFNASDLEVEKEDGEIVEILDVGTMILKKESFGDIYRMYMFERVIVLEGHIAEKFQALKIQGMKLMKPEKWDGILNEKD